MGNPLEVPCKLAAKSTPHDAHLLDGAWARCPGYSEPDEGYPEPGAPPTVAEQVRDLERIIECVREAVATDQPVTAPDDRMALRRDLSAQLRDALGLDNDPAIDALGAARDMAKDRERLRETLAEVLAQFTDRGHPGAPCLRTPWIRTPTVERWRAVLKGSNT